MDTRCFQLVRLSQSLLPGRTNTGIVYTYSMLADLSRQGERENGLQMFSHGPHSQRISPTKGICLRMFPVCLCSLTDPARDIIRNG